MSQQQLQQMQISQSLQRIQVILAEATGIAHQLLSSPLAEQQAQGMRLQQVVQRLTFEQQTIEQIVNSGRPAVSQAEMEVGSQVQNALIGGAQI